MIQSVQVVSTDKQEEIEVEVKEQTGAATDVRQLDQQVSEVSPIPVFG